jgi:hypothetical protein
MSNSLEMQMMDDERRTHLHEDDERVQDDNRRADEHITGQLAMPVLRRRRREQLPRRERDGVQCVRAERVAQLRAIFINAHSTCR